jgi:glycosyltransferase involved in cell wall biosynthesis
MLLGEARVREVACVVALGLTDASAFGNVLLAQAGLPTIATARDDLRTLFAPDVVVTARRGALVGAVAALLADPAARAHYGRVLAADARRRFSPRRSAIRVVDLLCAARFGLERPGVARSDSPVTAAPRRLNRQHVGRLE